MLNIYNLQADIIFLPHTSSYLALSKIQQLRNFLYEKLRNHMELMTVVTGIKG